MGYHINERSDEIVRVSEEKYMARLNHTAPRTSVKEMRRNYCMGQPKEAIEFMNLTTSQCVRCKRLAYKRITPQHAKRWHNINILTPNYLLGKALELSTKMIFGHKKPVKVKKTEIKQELKTIYEEEIWKLRLLLIPTN